MGVRVVIDGNNLLHAVAEHGAAAAPGRETLVRLVERWARATGTEALLVFDGAAPRGPIGRQLASAHLKVCFSAPQTADDLIVEVIRKARDPNLLRVVSDDKAIGHEAGLRRCHLVRTAAFMAELFPPPTATEAKPAPRPEKPIEPSADERNEWNEAFGGDEDEPFDGYGAMAP